MADLVEGRPRLLLRRLWPLGLLALAVGLVFAFGLDERLSLGELAAHRAALAGFVSEHAVAAVLLYLALYVINTALSLPSATVLTLAGGFLFGAPAATVYTVIGATIGATLVFLAARSAFGDALRRRARGWVKTMEQGFRTNALSYLLILRLIPIFPFFIVNLVPALLGVRLTTFVLATFIGIIPGSFVYALAGAGLGDVLEAGETLSPGTVLTPRVLGALGGLAILALLPVFYKLVKARREKRAG
ncbi:MAG TPA: TVP38/TMEM64 family protein [Alphaproteobacteria bacterium]|nr:TVP38/TMEM64 family protein [Alphaproteobacteria bacterium]